MRSCYLCGNAITPKPGPGRWCDECDENLREEIVMEFMEGLTLVQIAINCEMSASRVSKILTSKGIL